MVTIQQGLREDGFIVSMVKLCRWFGVPRRSVYYRSTKAPAKVTPALAEPIKALIEAEPSFGYRTVAGLLRMNKNTVQRIFQLQGWQVRKRAVGKRPRIEALPSVASAPDQRWWPAAGIHHTILPTAERHGGACHPHVEGAVRASASLRNAAARDARDWRLDPVLQPPAPPSGARHEDPRRGLCFSGLTCAGSAGSLQPR
jgi:hypothetical protein